MTEYTMDTFYAEMEKRDVRIARTTRAPRREAPAPSPPVPQHGTRARYNLKKCRCAACRAANSAYYHTLKKKRERSWLPSPPPPQRTHGLTIERVVACGVHPLHTVKVQANGARSGCTMCEMQIESICHAFSVRR